MSSVAPVATPVKRTGMSIKSDRWIRMMAQEYDMINPFADRQQATGMISYGLSSYGYDLRVSDEFKIFTNVNNAIVDPKDFRDRKSTRLNSSHPSISYAVFCLKKKKCHQHEHVGEMQVME